MKWLIDNSYVILIPLSMLLLFILLKNMGKKKKREHDKQIHQAKVIEINKLLEVDEQDWDAQM